MSDVQESAFTERLPNAVNAFLTARELPEGFRSEEILSYRALLFDSSSVVFLLESHDGAVYVRQGDPLAQSVAETLTERGLRAVDGSLTLRLPSTGVPSHVQKDTYATFTLWATPRYRASSAGAAASDGKVWK